MPRVTMVTCDQCKKDISETGNCVDYRIALLNESMPNHSGHATLAMKYPHLPHDCYFCSWYCLSEWIKAQENKGVKQ